MEATASLAANRQYVEVEFDDESVTASVLLNADETDALIEQLTAAREGLL